MIEVIFVTNIFFLAGRFENFFAIFFSPSQKSHAGTYEMRYCRTSFNVSKKKRHFLFDESLVFGVTFSATKATDTHPRFFLHVLRASE